MRLLLVVIGSAFPLIASSGEQVMQGDAQGRVDKEDITLVVNRLSDCAGVYDFFNEIEKTMEAHSTTLGEQWSGLKRGAVLSAMYLLYLENIESGKPKKRFEDFQIYPEGRAEVKFNQLRQLLRQEKYSDLDREQAQCLETLELQKELVQKIRDSAVGR